MAKSYELVLAAARHYWNNVLPLVGEPMERQLLREPLEVVLRCVAAVAENNTGKDEEVRHISTLFISIPSSVALAR